MLQKISRPLKTAIESIECSLTDSLKWLLLATTIYDQTFYCQSSSMI